MSEQAGAAELPARSEALKQRFQDHNSLPTLGTWF
jgi:hypothetical protein